MLRILIQYHGLFLQGFTTTLLLFSLAAGIGVPVGVVLGIIGGRFNASFGKGLAAFRFVTKIIPFLVLLFWLHYPLQALLGVVVNPFLTATFSLILIDASMTASIVGFELKTLPSSYREAGVTLGMTSQQIIRHVELPLLLRRMSPQILSNQASILEYTLLTSLISVPELFRIAQSINAMLYRPVEIYSLLVIFFVIILAPLHVGVSLLQKRYVSYS